MPFPEGWPPRAPAGYSRIRFFKEGALTADFADNAWMFSSMSPNKALPYVAPGSTAPVDLSPGVSGGGRDPHDAYNGVPVQVATLVPRFLVVWNDGALGSGVILEVSFDGVVVHDVLLATENHSYEDRLESGISVRTRGVVGPFRVIAY